jgi:DHA1 family tetracycline resistance protein-like MFS transporter
VPSHRMLPIILTVFTGFIGFSLPFPIFSHLFLAIDSTFLPASLPIDQRKILLGLALALYPLGQVLSAPGWGRYSDHHGRKPAITVSLIVASIGMALVAFGVFANNLWAVLLGRFISGLGEGNMAIAQAMASDESRDHEAGNFAAISIAMNAGWIIGPLLGGFLGDPTASPFSSPPLPFALAVGLYLFNLLVVMVCVEEHPVISTKTFKPNPIKLTRAFRRSNMLTVLALTLLAFWGVYTLFSYLPPYLVQMFASTPTDIGIYCALLSVPLIIAGLVTSPLNRWLDIKQITFLALLLMTSGLLFLTRVNSLQGLILPVSMVAFGIVLIEVTSAQWVSRLATPEEKGELMGIYRSVVVIAEVIATLAAGYLASLGVAMPFIIASAIVVCALFLLFRLPLDQQTPICEAENACG